MTYIRLLCTSFVAAEKGANIEMVELVDDFVTFYLAGDLKTLLGGYRILFNPLSRSRDSC